MPDQVGHDERLEFRQGQLLSAKVVLNYLKSLLLAQRGAEYP